MGNYMYISLQCSYCKICLPRPMGQIPKGESDSSEAPCKCRNLKIIKGGMLGLWVYSELPNALSGRGYGKTLWYFI